MTEDGKVNARGGLAIGGATLMGLGAGFIFLQTSALLFVACLIIGVGVGSVVAALMPGH